MTLERQRPTNTRWMIFALSCAVSFILYLHRYTWGFVKAEVGTEFGWDKTTLGWLDSAFYISYAVGQVPGGMFGSDENCRPGFTDPRQAVETCGMAEMMLSAFSLSLLRPRIIAPGRSSDRDSVSVDAAGQCRMIRRSIAAATAPARVSTPSLA